MTAPPAGALEACLALLEEYLEAREDVVDGDYGQPAPNEEMNLLRELREARPALLAALRLREWRPIETAPKDGSLFLGWVAAERWSAVDGGGSGRSADTSEVDFCQWRNMATGGFYENMMGQIGDAQDITHWMPLPAPPSADDLARVLEEGE